MASKLRVPIPRKQKYGLQFSDKWSALDIEIHCFKVGRSFDQGGLGKVGHFWNIVAYLWGPNNPVGNKTKIFIRNPWSEDMIEDAAGQEYLGVGGPASCSKSETLALWVLINYLADPRNVLVGILSTSLKEARKRIWGSLVEFVRAVPQLPLKVVDSQGIIRYESPKFRASDKAVIALIAAERKQAREAVGKLIGMHNTFVMIVADELSELMDSILEYAMPGGNLASNPRHQFVGLSNPVSYFDPFAKLWKPKDGWLSINVDSTRWETAHGIGLHFDAMKSPNVLAGKVLYPFLPTQEKIDAAKKAEGGENSLRFWRMMRGFMRPTGQEDYIYTEVDVVAHRGDEPAIWGDEPVVRVAALDPGFTNGGDRSILYFGTAGKSKDGLKTINYDEYIELAEDVTSKVERAYQIAFKLKAACEVRGILPYYCAIDSTGAGGPFCDIVATVWSPQILRVMFGGKASDLPVSMTDPKPASERYHDRVTEIWYSAKELLRQNQLKGIHPDMVAEMSARKYGTIGAKKLIYVESKTDMKLRTGGKSPDIADAGFLLIVLARERLDFVTILTASQKAEQRQTSGALMGRWKSICQRKNVFRSRQQVNL